MRHNTIIFIILFFIFPLVANAGDYAYEKSGNIYYVNHQGKVLQLTHADNAGNPILSPDEQQVLFIQHTHDRVPDNCDFADGPDYADDLWSYDLHKMTQKVLVTHDFSCKQIEKMILNPNNVQFSPDGKTVYFETSAWMHAFAIHAVDLDGNNLHFVVGGSEYDVVIYGRYKGDLIVTQHRYRFKGDTPLGSYDWAWLYTPTGKQIKVYSKEEDDD